MSPHAPSPPAHVSCEHSLLDKYAVTRNGFVPEQAPPATLSDPYYEPWEFLIHGLPQHLEDQTLRARVDALAVLSTDRLSCETEWRRAYTIFTFLSHAYIWGGRQPADVLPPAITVPFLRVSYHLELPPVATYAGLNLWNFSSRTADCGDLDRIHAQHTFTGTKDESWFYMVSVTMETQGGPIIPIMLRALAAVPRRDFATITTALGEYCACVGRVSRLLERMYEGCDPDVFYHQIRPFLAGSRNMASAGLPRGVLYDEGHGRDQWRQLRGGSNGQSSLVHFLDIVLGVVHRSTGNGSPHAGTEQSFHDEVRDYMPGPHRRLLEHVGRMGSLRALANLVPEQAAPPDQVEFAAAYQRAVRALVDFRNKHLQMVTRYIVVPSRQARRGTDVGKVNLATSWTARATGVDGKTTDLTGTGGTALLPFLKQSRDETSEAACIQAMRR